MSFILQYFDELAKEEDDELIDLLKSEYWYILFLSMLIPRWKNRLLSFSLLLFYSFNLFLHLGMLIYALYLAILEENWELASLLIHYIILLALAIYLPLFFNAIRKTVVDIHKTFSKGIGHYSSGRIYDEQPCVDIKREIRIETYYYLTMPALVSLVGAVALLGPYLSKWYSGMEDAYSPNELSMQLPVPAYYPFPTDKGLIHFVIAGTQLLVCGILALLIVAPGLIFINVNQKINFELRVIGYSMDSLVKRSMKLMNKEGIQKWDSEMDLQREVRHLAIEDNEFQRTIELCIKETIIHHQILTGYLSVYKEVAKHPLAAGLTVGFLTIGISLYNISTALKANEIGTVTTFVLLLAAETLATLVQCALGSSLTERSEVLRDKLYFIEWYNFDLKNRKLLLNELTAITKPYVIKAAGVVNMNMDTFSSILNSAYSFFNLMQTVE